MTELLPAVTTWALLVGLLLLVGAIAVRLRGVQAEVDEARRLLHAQIEPWQAMRREVAAIAEQVEHIRELLVALDRDLREPDEEP